MRKAKPFRTKLVRAGLVSLVCASVPLGASGADYARTLSFEKTVAELSRDGQGREPRQRRAGGGDPAGPRAFHQKTAGPQLAGAQRDQRQPRADRPGAEPARAAGRCQLSRGAAAGAGAAGRADDRERCRQPRHGGGRRREGRVRRTVRKDARRLRGACFGRRVERREPVPAAGRDAAARPHGRRVPLGIRDAAGQGRRGARHRRGEPTAQ